MCGGTYEKVNGRTLYPMLFTSVVKSRRSFIVRRIGPMTTTRRSSMRSVNRPRAALSWLFNFSFFLLIPQAFSGYDCERREENFTNLMDTGTYRKKREEFNAVEVVGVGLSS